MSIVSTGHRTTDKSRSGNSTRSMVVFEVLDYDSLTHVIVNGEYVDVTALIYKKVTITHSQQRDFTLHYETDDVIPRTAVWFPEMSLNYLDPAADTDEYVYTGTRTVEYRLCLIVGQNKYEKSLGTVVTTVSGSYNLAGTDKELKEGSVSPTISGPQFSCTGNRLYGVSVNCGKDAMTYSYDIEELDATKDLNSILQTDSPINIEDYNDYWIKASRTVGVMNYYGIEDSKDFSYGTAGTSILPDKVMAVCYKEA